MIISHTYRFAFIHIPKCAGTTVRSPLQVFDDTQGAHTGRVAEHSVLGSLDYVHIPLFILQEYFETDFEKIRDYWSFAVIRDPFARFASSISQRLNRYVGQSIHKVGAAEIAEEVECSIDFLKKQPRQKFRLPPEYIHFQKQVDFIYLDDEQVVDTIYSVDEIHQLLRDVSSRVGFDLRNGDGENGVLRANQTMVHRNETTRRLIERTRPVTQILIKALPEAVQHKFRTLVYVPRDQRLESIFSAASVKDFINDYYSEDVELWNEIARPRPLDKD
jgi:hypothetical protein